MDRFPVIAEFIDQESGKRIYPGSTFLPKTAKHRDRLMKAKCLGKEPVINLSEKPIEEMTREELESVATMAFTEQLGKIPDDALREGILRHRNGDTDADLEALMAAGGENDSGDGLDDQTIDDLKKVAEAEEVDLTGKTVKADIIAAIRAKRAA